MLLFVHVVILLNPISLQGIKLVVIIENYYLTSLGCNVFRKTFASILGSWRNTYFRWTFYDRLRMEYFISKSLRFCYSFPPPNVKQLLGYLKFCRGTVDSRRNIEWIWTLSDRHRMKIIYYSGQWIILIFMFPLM